jgi:hypothetical protein
MKTLAFCLFFLSAFACLSQNEKQAPVNKEPPYYGGPYAQRALIQINTDTLHPSEKKAAGEGRRPEKKATDKQATKKEDQQ